MVRVAIKLFEGTLRHSYYHYEIRHLILVQQGLGGLSRKEFIKNKCSYNDTTAEGLQTANAAITITQPS